MVQRRLPVLVLGLSLATSVGVAAPQGSIDWQISSINGGPITPRKEVWIQPSDTVSMDIVYYGTPGWHLYGLGFRITATGGPGSLDPYSMIYDPEWELTWEIIDEITPGRVYEIQECPGDLGFPEQYPDGVVVLNHILFHCDGLQDVTITIEDLDPDGGTYTNEINWNTADWQGMTFGDGTIIIHQVPEPLSLSLLAFGGLTLLRKRRA